MNYYQRLQRIPFNEFRVWNDLLGAGYQTYLVGGAVRDIVLGKQPKDWDFATVATPDQIKEVFNRSDFKVDLVGATFGVVIVNGIEVATFRGDKYHGGGDRYKCHYFCSLFKKRRFISVVERSNLGKYRICTLTASNS